MLSSSFIFFLDLTWTDFFYIVLKNLIPPWMCDIRFSLSCKSGRKWAPKKWPFLTSRSLLFSPSPSYTQGVCTWTRNGDSRHALRLNLVDFHADNWQISGDFEGAEFKNWVKSNSNPSEEPIISSLYFNIHSYTFVFLFYPYYLFFTIIIGLRIQVIGPSGHLPKPSLLRNMSWITLNCITFNLLIFKGI